MQQSSISEICGLFRVNKEVLPSNGCLGTSVASVFVKSCLPAMH